MLPQGCHHAMIRGQLIGMVVRQAAADHHQVDPIGQGLVAQRGELDEFAAQRLQCLDRVGEVAAERLVVGVGHAEPAAAPTRHARSLRRVGKRPAAGELVDRREIGMLEEAPGQRVDQVLRDPAIAGHGLQRRADLGQWPRPHRARAGPWSGGPGDGAAAALPDRPPHPAGRRRHRPETAANGTSPSHSPGRRPRRRWADPGSRRWAADRRGGRITPGHRPLSGPRGSPRPATSRRRTPPARTARYKPTRASTRHRGDDPAGRSPARPPRWPSDRHGSGNAGPSNATGSTRPASPGTPRKAPDRTSMSPTPVAEAAVQRLADSQDGAQWHSSRSERPDAKALHGFALLNASRHVRARISSTL